MNTVRLFRRVLLFMLPVMLLMACEPKTQPDIALPPAKDTIELEPIDTAYVNIPKTARSVYGITMSQAHSQLLKDNWQSIEMPDINLEEFGLPPFQLTAYACGQQIEMDSITLYDHMIMLYSERADSVSLVLGVRLDTLLIDGLATYRGWDEWIATQSDLGRSPLSQWFGVMVDAEQTPAYYGYSMLGESVGEHVDFTSALTENDYLLAAGIYYGLISFNQPILLIECGFMPNQLVGYSISEVLVGNDSLLKIFLQKSNEKFAYVRKKS